MEAIRIKLDGDLLVLDELSGVLGPSERGDGESGREAGPAGRVGGDGVGDGLGVVQENTDVQVLDIVLGAVVVGVHLDASGSAPDSNLLGGFDVVGARVEPTAGDTDIEEGPVVRAAIELGCLPGDVVLVGVEILE